MYYYCNRNTMSASAVWPGAEGPQSCCGGGGGGGGELVNGNGGGEITEARTVGEWESATCDSADATRSASTESTVTREQEDGAARALSRCYCCRRNAAPGGGDDPRGINIDGEDGGVRCARCMGETRTAARRGACEIGARQFRNSEAAASKRRGCSYSGASKRACFSETSTAEEAAFHCGGSDPDSGTGSGGEVPVQNTAGSRQSREETFKPRQRGYFSNGSLSLMCEMKGAGGVINGDRRGCRTAKGRVRLHRVRSFLASTEGLSANGVPVAQLSDHTHCRARPQQKTQFRVASSGEAESGKGRRAVNGGPCAGVAGQTAASWLRQVEAAQLEAKRRQVQLGDRTDRLWRRLHAVQVKHVERHVTQQLGDLRRAAVAPSTAELSRLARGCTEALRTAGGALDSDHTASSSGGGSDTEEEEEEEEGGRGDRHVRPSRVKSVCTSREWQWMRERAWLGSRWVWLQAQVSELEYGIRALTELYTHLRQDKVSQLRAFHAVPETPLRAPRPSPAPHDCRFRKRLAEDSAPSAQTPPSPTSSAARIRPLLRQCRHRLLRWEGCPAPGPEAVTAPCGCEPPAACVLCGPPHRPADDKSTWMCQEVLDQRVHPVLSMPSDFPLVAHCATPPIAGHHSRGAVRWASHAASSCMGRRGQGPQKAGRVRRRLVCPRPPSTLPPLFNTSGGSNCRSQRGVVSPGLLHQQVADLAPTDTPTQPRRRRGESSFDIDNLVMPLGLAGLGARVQKLQYKEIITPSWRELDSVWGVYEKLVGSDVQCVKHLDAPRQPSGEGLDHEGEVEDLSAAVFLKRHAVWESRERSRWGSWARRRHRGRSSSCYGDRRSCRGLEQASCSPEPRQGKSSPCSPVCSAADDPLDQMDDEQQSLQPWERRSFPLLEEELHWLQDDEEAELEEDACAASGRSQSTDSGISVGSLELSPRTPQPPRLHSGGQLPAACTTQDSDSALPSLTPPSLSSLPSASARQNPSNYRVNNEPASLCPQTSSPA